MRKSATDAELYNTNRVEHEGSRLAIQANGAKIIIIVQSHNGFTVDSLTNFLGNCIIILTDVELVLNEKLSERENK